MRARHRPVSGLGNCRKHERQLAVLETSEKAHARSPTAKGGRAARLKAAAAHGCELAQARPDLQWLVVDDSGDTGKSRDRRSSAEEVAKGQ